jgi:hypothetical protein
MKRHTEKQLHHMADMLQSHPLTHQKLAILQYALYLLSQQIEWSKAGPLARWLITLKLAMTGTYQSESVAGFVGPHLERLERGLTKIIKEIIPHLTSEHLHFLTTIHRLVFYSIFFLIVTKEIFTRELVFLFVSGSRFIPQLFQSLTQELEIETHTHEKIIHLQTTYVLLLLLAIAQEEKDQEWLETLYPFIHAHLSELQTLPILQPMAQLLTIALEAKDTDAIKSLIERELQLYNVTLQDVVYDLKKLKKFLNNLKIDFDQIFSTKEAVVSSITQAA